MWVPTVVLSSRRQRCILAAVLSRVGGNMLPGISLAVVLPGYDVLKKLSSCHPVEKSHQHLFFTVHDFYPSKEQLWGHVVFVTVWVTIIWKTCYFLAQLKTQSFTWKNRKCAVTVGGDISDSQIKHQIVETLFWYAVMESNCRRDAAKKNSSGEKERSGKKPHQFSENLKFTFSSHVSLLISVNSTKTWFKCVIWLFFTVRNESF